MYGTLVGTVLHCSDSNMFLSFLFCKIKYVVIGFCMEWNVFLLITVSYNSACNELLHDLTRTINKTISFGYFIFGTCTFVREHLTKKLINKIIDLLLSERVTESRYESHLVHLYFCVPSCFVSPPTPCTFSVVTTHISIWRFVLSVNCFGQLRFWLRNRLV